MISIPKKILLLSKRDQKYLYRFKALRQQTGAAAPPWSLWRALGH